MIRAMSVAIVDYGSGNLHSAAKAFERAARESGHDQPIVVTRDPDAVRRADRVVLPGVGAFADCRRGLDAVPGMVEALEETVRGKGRPFLGICVGMQLMAERGREYVVTDGPRLDPRRGRQDHAVRPGAENPAHGLEHARRARRRTSCSTAFRSGPTACTPISCTPISFGRRTRADLVAQADYGGPVTAIVGARQHGRHAIPPGKEPKTWACADRQFPEMEAVGWQIGPSESETAA